MKKWLLVSLLFIVLLAPAFAQAIVVDTEPVKNQIAYDETARFRIIITNNQDMTDKFLFASTPSQLGSGTLWRFIPQTVTIISDGSEDVILDITPPKDIRVGTYDIDITTYSATDPKIRGTGIVRLQIIKEFPHLEANIGMPGELYPGTLPVNIIVENDGVETQGNITAVFESDLFGAYDLEIGTLKAGESRLVFNQDITIPTATEVGKYDAKVVFYKNGEYVVETKKDITILGKGDLAISQDIDKGVLTTKYKVTITNVGNAQSDEQWSTVMHCMKRFLISSSKEPTVDVDPGKTATFIWPIVLAPGESTVINYQISYAPVLALIIAILFMIYVFAWYFRKEFTLTKQAQTKKGHLEVKLIIKNNTSEIQHDVIVEDKVPTPLKLVKEFGTQAPTAIKKEAGAVKMIWKFRHFGPFEERILTYGLKSSLGIVGLIILPAAVLKAKVDKTLKRFYSNTFTIKGRISVKEKEESE